MVSLVYTTTIAVDYLLISGVGAKGVVLQSLPRHWSVELLSKYCIHASRRQKDADIYHGTSIPN
jgi:hypothetical protein